MFRLNGQEHDTPATIAKKIHVGTHAILTAGSSSMTALSSRTEAACSRSCAAAALTG